MRVEARENIDYVYVIHRQLDRIAQIRTSLYDAVKDEGEWYPVAARCTMVGRVQRYLTAVETLYFMLHPNLRGDAGDLLMRAREAVRICLRLVELYKTEHKLEEDIESLRNELEKLESRACGQGRISREQEEKKSKLKSWLIEAEEELKQVEEKIEKLHGKLFGFLPTDWQERLDGKELAYYQYVILLADVALEEMLKRLDAAGLLMRADRIRVGVA